MAVAWSSEEPKCHEQCITQGHRVYGYLLPVGGRVGPRNCTARPSRPGESHPEALTDPCLSLSVHTARAIHGETALSVTTRRFLPLPVDQSGYDANDPPPSLHGHYPISSLLLAWFFEARGSSCLGRLYRSATLSPGCAHSLLLCRGDNGAPEHHFKVV